LERCRALDPLKTWNGILIDGHNRFAICTKHGLPFDVLEVAGIETRVDAKIWIIQNQFGRRNLDTLTRCELALTLEPLVAEKAARARSEAAVRSNAARSANPVSSNLTKPDATKPVPLHTRPGIAKAAGVSEGTIHMAKAVLAQVDDKTNATMYSTNASSTKTRKMLDCG